MFVVGIGPGGPEHRTAAALAAIAGSDVVAGYRKYLDLIADLTPGKELIASGMTQEVQRCRAALEAAESGRTVSLVSSGDPGIYGMAGLAVELADRLGLSVPIEIVPGVTAASAAAAALGAPLMLDFAVISLSDLLVPWDSIRRRLAAVAAADFVIALYNPKSTRRVQPFADAVAILLEHRPGSTPVGIVTDAGSPGQSVVITDLANLPSQPVTMRSMVIVGNSATKVIGGKLVTSRGYQV